MSSRSSLTNARERTSALASSLPPARPRLVPVTRLGQVALILILAFTFLRGALWSMTTPSFWGPDEDYHMMYVDTVAHEHRLINPSQPLFSTEYSRTTTVTHFNEYGQGPRLVYRGDPKSTIDELARLPASDREGSLTGRGIGVVHAPIFYLAGGAVDAALGEKAMPTRMFWVRMVSGLFGVLAVYAAWLLASVIVTTSAVALLAALIVACQPMLGFLSGLVSNDPAVVAASHSGPGPAGISASDAATAGTGDLARSSSRAGSGNQGHSAGPASPRSRWRTSAKDWCTATGVPCSAPRQRRAP